MGPLYVLCVTCVCYLPYVTSRGRPRRVTREFRVAIYGFYKINNLKLYPNSVSDDPFCLLFSGVEISCLRGMAPLL